MIGHRAKGLVKYLVKNFTDELIAYLGKLLQPLSVCNRISLHSMVLLFTNRLSHRRFNPHPETVRGAVLAVW